MGKQDTLTKIHDVLNQIKGEGGVTDTYIREHLHADLGVSSLAHTARKILDILAQHNTGMNQRTLAKCVGVSPQAISVQIKKLEQRGFLIKTSGTQKNENLITLTEVGYQVGIVLNQAVKHHADHALRDFNDEECARLMELLCKIKPYQKP